jgi:hypothetical protein
MTLYMDVHERQRRLNALRTSQFFGRCTNHELQPLLPLMRLERFAYVTKDKTLQGQADE